METMAELLDQARALGWYESSVCDDWIDLSPIAEKNDSFILTQIYVEWGKEAPKDYEIQEIGAGWKFSSTIKPIPSDILAVVKKMLALHEKENQMK